MIDIRHEYIEMRRKVKIITPEISNGRQV